MRHRALGQLDQRDHKRPNVGTRVVALATDHLRRHPVRSADDSVCLQGERTRGGHVLSAEAPTCMGPCAVGPCMVASHSAPARLSVPYICSGAMACLGERGPRCGGDAEIVQFDAARGVQQDVSRL